MDVDQEFDDSLNMSSADISPVGDVFPCDLSDENMSGEVTVLEAATVYLLMRRDIPISRTTRVQWLLDRLNTTVTLHPDDYNAWPDDEMEFKILSIVPTEPLHYHSETNHCFKYLITPNTKLKFIANSYRIVYCLDMSPSQSAVDIQHGEILFDEVLTCFKHSLEGLSQPFTVPGSDYEMKPTIYLTVIAHTPFFMTPAQQVLVKGVQVTLVNLKEIFYTVERQLKMLEEKIADVSGMAQVDFYEQKIDTEKLINQFEELSDVHTLPNVPMVSPDANFVNMLRYSMLALSLLPENSLSNILVITDGVVSLPDINIMESLLNQLHYDSTTVSFIKVGSSFHPHVYAGYVPYTDILHFLSYSTMGACLESCPEVTTQHSLQMNLYHKAYLCWTFHNINDENHSFTPDSNDWNTPNEYFHGKKIPILLRKKQNEDKMNASLLLLLSRRIREGYTVNLVRFDNNLLQIDLSLPWKNFIYLQYTLTTQWPSTQSVLHYDVHIAAPYEFLHDITCLMNKELKSGFRQAVIERFWYALTHLANGDSALAQHLNSFHTSNLWFTLPESVKSGMPVFIMMNSIQVEATKPQFTAGDLTSPKFSAIWQPICQLENYQWNKWFHTHKISLIVHHDDPLPKNLHLANSSGRFQIVQCRQAATILYGKLCEWASFVLIENHSYVKFLYSNTTEKPTWFCILRVTSKLPCAVINIGFVNATPGYIRQKVCGELRDELTQLFYVTSPLKCKEKACCTILHKPLEKILIRYERMPSDFSTVVFPDGTQPPNPHQILHPPPVTGALFTTLSRYLYHKRWIWNAAHSNNAKLGVNAIARILSTITKMRIKEGFTFAHSSSGIINMVLEIEMSTFFPQEMTSNNENLSCVIQYVLFPPHCTTREDLREQISGSEDDTDFEPESEVELQMVTEVWIEPQYGQLVNSMPSRSYMNFEPYYRLADKIGLIDSKCISSLLTLEHLSLMCQTKSNRIDDYKPPISLSENKSIRRISTGSKTSKSKVSVNGRNSQSTMYLEMSPTKHDFSYFDKNLNSPKSIDTVFQGEPAPLMDDRIHYIPFNFNLSNILPVSQQTELLFSMFIEDDNEMHTQFELEQSNKLFLETFHDHLQLLHDRELNINLDDSQHFLDLLITRHSKNQETHTCPISTCSNSLINGDILTCYPQWRCFIKGISITHVILTFVPSTVKDIKTFCSFVNFKDDCYLSDSSVKPNLPTRILTPTPSNTVLESQDSISSNMSDSYSLEKESLTLPVFIYDCPLTVIMNSYVNPKKNSKNNELKDIYINHKYKPTIINIDEHLQLRHDRHTKHKSPDTKSDDSETSNNKTYVKQHCKTLIHAHSKCFVASLYKSLHSKYSVHYLDVQSAVDQCEETIDEIDITDYLKIVCGHLKLSTATKINLTELSDSSPCLELKPLHNLIKDKFIKIIKTSFQPIPTNPEFYFCLRSVTPDKMTNKDDDSDDEMSIPSEIIEFKSEKDSLPCSNGISCITNVPSNNSTEITDIDDKEVTPLFLHLMCSIHVDNTIYPMPVKVLPTCLGDLINEIDLTNKNINLSNFRVTLDIICLTLPPDVQTVTCDASHKGLRNTSFCSVSPCPVSSMSSDTSLISDDNFFTETMFNLNYLPELQLRAVTSLKEEIKWLLSDEMATSLLDLEPVTIETLNKIITHIESSSSRFSCKRDVITLNFVYGSTYSHAKFLQEFKRMPISILDNTVYKLCEENDLYYLVKNNTEVYSESFSTTNIFSSTIDNFEDKSKISLDFQIDSDRQDFKVADEDSGSVFYEDKECTEQPPVIVQVIKGDTELKRPEIDHGQTFCQKSDISSTSSLLDIEDGMSDAEEDFEWLDQLENKRRTMPNFWLILRIEQDAVTIYFHCRFLKLQTSKVYNYLSVQRSVITAIKNLCKKVNQSLLLQSLHDTRMCDKLLEPEDDKKDIWYSDNTTPTITRNTSFVRLKSMDETLSDGQEYHQAAYLEASLKFMPGFFRCDVVWQTHFFLHPRLKTGPGKSGLSRGIQALRTVLNKFSVSNRSNMFVYQDNSSSVFYLRLHENMPTYSKLLPSRSDDKSNILVSRSPSIVSLPINQQKSVLISNSDQKIVTDIRPRVRSLGEREKTDVSFEDTIILKVHGITDVGLDIRCDLVQVLQNRLDDAVLEVLSMMLARNAMCPLTPEDVSFLQREFSLPDDIVRLTIPEVGATSSSSFIHFLQQNLLQFLNLPKYTDPNRSNHFKDYYMPYHISKCISEDQIFLYNQSQNPSSGNRGIACIAFATFNNSNKNSGQDLEDDDYIKIFENRTFDEVVESNFILTDDKCSDSYLEFRIWKQGRVNSDSLNTKLKLAVSHAIWDLITEFYLLRVPLCINYEAPPTVQKNSSKLKFLEHKITRGKRNIPVGLKITRKLTIDSSLSVESAPNAAGNFVDSIRNPIISASTELLKLIELNDANALKINLTKLDKGESGAMHQVYSDKFKLWFEFSIKIGVPSVKKCSVPFTHRTTAEVCVRELQHIVSILAPDTTTRPFEMMDTFKTDDDGQNKEIYVPWNTCKTMMKCLLIGRNFDQWKILKMSNIEQLYGTYYNGSLLKHYQKFVPHLNTTDNTFVPRQRLLFATITSEFITIYTYNWSRERSDKLASQVANLSLWCSARISVLNSIISQKMGLFQNQLVTRKTTHSLNNPYLSQTTDCTDHLYKFPSTSAAMSKDWINRKQMQTNSTTHGTIIDTYRDNRPTNEFSHKKGDPVMVYSQEMTSLKQRVKQYVEEKKKMHSIYQSRGVTIGISYSPAMLERHARTIHYVHTPLLFLPRWRLQSAATRDHSLTPELLDESILSTSKLEKHHTDMVYNEVWHNDLCIIFIKEYKNYLQTLGFVPLDSDNKRDKVSLIHIETLKNTICYVQKPMLGGVMVFSIQLREPFFTVKLHALECCRVNQKTCRPSINQFTLSFLDECDRIKSLMHLHSFTYDFHLRCIHSYVANNPGVKVCNDYHLTKFLDDFNKYYPKTPNFARNLVWAETMTIENLLTEGQQLYTYLLSNNKQYGMNILSMKREEAPVESNAEYILVQVTNTPQVWYKDSQDRKQTDDFDVTLIISNIHMPWQSMENVLQLKFYIILTSRREIYPKSDVEKTLGKFRTVSSTGCSLSQGQEIKMISCNDLFSKDMVKNLLQTDKSLSECESEKSQDGENSVFGPMQDQEIIRIDSLENSTEQKSDDKSEEEKFNSKSVEMSHLHMHVEIKQESVNYLGYYSSHEQLMQQLIIDRATATRQQIKQMVAQGMVHCRTHLLWNKLVSHQETKQLTYKEFMELRGLAKMENLIDFHPDLKILLDQPFTWYQGLMKVLLTKYSDQHRVYVSPDGNIQHVVILHPRYIGTFMMVSMDLHTSRGDLYTVSREPPQLDLEVSNTDRLELINGFINCIAAHIWTGLV